MPVGEEPRQRSHYRLDLLDRQIDRGTARLLSSLDELPSFRIAQAFERPRDVGDRTKDRKLRDVLGGIQDMPHGVQSGARTLIFGRQRNDAEELREVGVARAAHQKSIGQIAVLVGVGPKPGAFALTGAERTRFDAERIVQRTRRDVAFATNPCLRDVAARAALLEPHSAPATWSRAAVSEHAPVEIVQMAAWTAAHETDGNDLLRSARSVLVVAEATVGQFVPTHETAAAPLTVGSCGPRFL